MDTKSKHWSLQETNHLLGIWSSAEVQNKLVGASRTKQVIEEIQKEMTAAGYSRTFEQINNKLKKLRKEYRDSRKVVGLSANEQPPRNTHFDVLDSVLGDRLACPTTWAFNSATSMLEAVVDDRVLQSSATNVTGPASTATSKNNAGTGSLDPTTPTSAPAASMTAHVMTPSTDVTPRYQVTDSPTLTFIPVSCSGPFSTTAGPTEDPQNPGFHSIEIELVESPSRRNTVGFAAVQTPVREKRFHRWTKEEVQVLMTLWSDPAVQEKLLVNRRNSDVYIRLSAKMALLGFNKPAISCREKIKKLKQKYKRIKSDGNFGNCKRTWFGIMNNVLSSQAAGAQCQESAEPSPLSQSQSVRDVDSDDETLWLPDEVQVLMTLWAQPNIQKKLLTPGKHNEVFMYLSSELALVGFNKSAHQCSCKVNNLKEEYRKTKEVIPYRGVENNWFAILDSVLGPGGETSTVVDSTQENKPVNDMFKAYWTQKEIKVLLTRWAEENIQEQLRSTQENERAYAQLSSDLATQGFDKTTSQCRSKIKALKRKYSEIKEHKDSKRQKSRWFALMDKVLCQSAGIKQEAEVMDPLVTVLKTTQQDLSDTKEDSGCRLSVSSLCLLVPTLRLMCAFAWHVVQCCNVQHYGKVVELVKLVTELTPELLKPREKVQLLLRLRARMVLELCRSESTAKLLNIQPHLEVIQNLTMGSTCDQQELEQLESSKSNFVEVVHKLLEDTEERETFFKEVFPIHYGQQYEATLHTLVWKLISRLDNLLPIPDIKQTAEWLGTAPSVMEECGQLILEPEQLKALLHFHQQQAGSTSKCYSQAQNMFLPTLSLSHRPNLRELTSEQQTDSDEGLFDYSEDEEDIEDIQTDDEQTLEHCSKGDEVLKLTEEQSGELTATNGLNLNSHMPLGSHTCSLCSYSDSQVSGLLQHIRSAHLTQEPSQLQSNEPRTSNAIQKVDTETGSPEIRSSTSTFANVFNDVFTLNSQRKTRAPAFHCDKCDRKYLSKNSLKAHRRIHTGETPYLCSHCGRGFTTSTGLDYHVRIHTADRRFKCHICGKTSIQHMTRHMRMHRGEKNYLCSECGKAFLSSGELRLHMRFHTGERPHTCKHCGKGFTAKCQLVVHMRKHTGERPYRCSVCPKSFKTLRMLKRHLAIHSNKKSFQCLRCGKIFRQEDTFKMHVQTHD